MLLGNVLRSALGIEVEIFCEVTNKRLQRIARPAGERPNKMAHLHCFNE
jgi:hypothetical protein